MGVMAEWEYPDIKISEAVEIIQKIDEKNIERLDVLAGQIGHKGPTAYRGGAFRMKITALFRYGLLTGKPSELQLSDLAKNIVHPRDEAAKVQSIRKAVLLVPLLAKVHDKLQGKIPADFWVPLYDCTGVDQKDVKEHAENIRKLYADAVQYLQATVETTSVKGKIEDDMKEGKSKMTAPEGMMRLVAPGGTDLTLPFKPESFKMIRVWLDSAEQSYKKGNKEDSESRNTKSP